MIQNQLIDYIDSQLKLGISKEVVKTSLVGAGWPMADVNETIQHMESGGGKVAAIATPAVNLSPKSVASTSPKLSDAQTIRMSDLISTSDSAKVMKASITTPVTAPVTAAAVSPMAKIQAPIITAPPSSMASMAQETKQSGKGGSSMKVFGTIIALLALAGLSGFLFFQNTTLAAKILALSAQSAKVTTDLATLNQSINASSTGFGAEIAGLNTQNADLLLNLSFYAVPPAEPIGPSRVIVTGAISGGGKAIYLLTTKYGAKIAVQNSKDPKVIAWLTPLVGTTATISGTYIPGTPAITAIPPEAAAAPVAQATSTTTATSSVK